MKNFFKKWETIREVFQFQFSEANKTVSFDFKWKFNKNLINYLY